MNPHMNMGQGLPCQHGSRQCTSFAARIGSGISTSMFSRSYRIVDGIKVFNSKKDVDWDGAWKRFQNTNNRQQQAPPAFDRRQKVSSPLDKIRKQEERVLGAWSSTRFTQLGIASVIFLLIIMVVVAGGLPSDSRCTLPWC